MLLFKRCIFSTFWQKNVSEQWEKLKETMKWKAKPMTGELRVLWMRNKKKSTKDKKKGVRGWRLLLWGESDAAGRLGDGRRWYWHHVNPRGCALMLTTALCWSINHTHTHTHTGEVNNCLAHNAHTVFTSFFPPPSSSLASSLSSSLLLLHLSSKSWPHSFFVCSPPLNPLFVTSPTSFSLPFVSLSFLPSAVILFSPPLLLSPPLRCDLIPVDRVSFLCCN